MIPSAPAATLERPDALDEAMAPAHRAWRHRFASFHVAATWFLLIWGASVTSHDAGLAVPDWPSSFGWLNPFAVPMVGNVFYEHGHREVAAFVGLLTVVLAVWLWRTAETKSIRRLGVAQVVLVVLQGGLGGLTVHAYLPPAVSIVHGMLAQTFFCLSLLTAYRLSGEWRATARRAGEAAAPLLRVASVAASAVYVQLLLGAIVRHCWKKEMPADAFPGRFADLLPPFPGPPVNGALAAAILAHGAFALIVALALIVAATFVLRRHGAERRLARPALALLVLLVMQLALGLLTFMTKTNANVTTTHVVTGATILGVAFLLVLRALRAPRAELR